MANDIYVSFGGDTAGLESSLASAKASVAAFSRELARLAREQVKTGADAESALGQKMLAVAAKLDEAKRASFGLKDQLSALSGPGAGAGAALEATGGHAIHAGAGLGFYTWELRALADEAASGRWRQFDGSLINFTVHGAQAAAAFASINPVLTAIGAAAAAAAAAIGFATYEASAAANAVKQIQIDAVEGQFKLTSAAAATLRDDLVKLGNLGSIFGSSTVEEYAAPFLKLGEAGPVIAKLTIEYAELTKGSKKLGEVGDEIAKYFADLSTKGRELVQSTAGITSTQKANYDIFVASNQTLSAYGMIVDALRARYETYRQQLITTRAAQADQTTAMLNAADEAMGGAHAMNQVSAATAKATADIEANTAAWNRNRAALEGAASAARTLQAGLAEALKVDKVAGGIKEAGAEIAKLEAGIAAAGDKSSPAIDALGRALEIARANLSKLQEQARDGILGRDALKQAQDANELLASGFKGPQTGLLTAQRAARQGVANSAAPGSDEQLEAQKAVAAKTKEIRDAENEDYLRQDEIKVASAGKNSAEIIAIRQAEVAREISIFGEGSNQAIAAEERLAKAKEAAANRGAATATKAAKDELGATEEGIKGQIAALERHTAAVIDHLGVELKLHQITAQAEVAAVVAALAQEKAAADALYSHLAELAGVNQTKKAEFAEQEQALNDKVAEKIFDSQAKAAEKTEQAWDKTMTSINGAFDSQIRRLAEGYGKLAHRVQECGGGFDRAADQVRPEFGPDRVREHRQKRSRHRTGRRGPRRRRHRSGRDHRQHDCADGADPCGHCVDRGADRADGGYRRGSGRRRRRPVQRPRQPGAPVRLRRRHRPHLAGWPRDGPRRRDHSGPRAVLAPTPAAARASPTTTTMAASTSIRAAATSIPILSPVRCRGLTAADISTAGRRVRKMNSEIADASASTESEPSAQPPSGDDGRKLDLKFIREQIWRMMMTEIATAKAETLGAFATANQGTISAVAVTIAGSNHAAVCLALSIVAALAERGVLYPNDVIRWAEWMASNQSEAIEPTVSESAARTLRSFTKILTSMALPRPSRSN